MSGFDINSHPGRSIFLPHQPLNVELRRVWVASPLHNPLVAVGETFFLSLSRIFESTHLHFKAPVSRCEELKGAVCCVCPAPCAEIISNTPAAVVT